jgi:hypothetical protein
MTQPVTLTPEEMQFLTSFQDRFNLITKRYGELMFQNKLLARELRSAEEEMDKIESDRIQMMENLQTKYGPGSIDLTTGQFFPGESKIVEMNSESAV